MTTSSVPASAVLTAEEVKLLQLYASGYRNRQICQELGLTIGELQIMRDKLYKKLGAYDLRHQARAFALAKAITMFGLKPPIILVTAIEAIQSGTVRLTEEFDIQVLKSMAEGRSLREIAGQSSHDTEELLERLSDLLRRLGLAPYPPFCVAAAAIWAGALTELDLTREYTPVLADLTLLRHIALGGDIEVLTRRLGVSKDVARARIRRLLFRLGVSCEAGAVGRAIRQGWLPIPVDIPGLQAKIDDLKAAGLAPHELVIIQSLEKGVSYQVIAGLLKDIGISAGVEYLVHRLYRRLGVHDAAGAVAVALWAGEPEAPEPEPVHPNALTERDLTILGLLLDGYEGAQIATHLGLSKSHSDVIVEGTYRKLGARKMMHAVAVASQGGYYDDAFEPAEIQRMTELEINPLYLRWLELQAQGRAAERVLVAELQMNSSTLRRRINAASPGLDMVRHRQIALLVRVGRIRLDDEVGEVDAVNDEVDEEVNDPDAVSAPAFIPRPAPVPASESAPVQVAVPIPLPVPAPAPDPVPEPSPDDELTAAYDRLAGRNPDDKEVINGKQILSRDLTRFVNHDSNFSAVVRLVREGRIVAPGGMEARLAEVAAKAISDTNKLLLGYIADNRDLDDIRHEIGEDIPAFMKRRTMLCAKLRARDMRGAVIIALWANIIE